jgi:type I restriction enzyme S subunit
MSSEPKSVGRVSPIGRNPTDRSQVSVSEHENVGLRCANPTYGVEWNEITFGDFIALQRGHDLPDQDRRPGVVPILGSFGVTGFHDTVKAKGPGVTIGRSGASFGVAAYIDKDYWPLNTALYVTNFKGNNPKFVFYFLKNFDFSAYNSGSAQPSLNRNNLYRIPVRVPAPSIQKNIADLLTAIDDRIALLRETNATLEAIAQALFKSWFVDFDPVYAKQQGSAPEGMDEATAALFPDSFEESELGLVPKGWKWAHLEAIAAVIMGLSPKGNSYNSDGIGTPLINGPVEFGDYFPLQTKWTTSPSRLAKENDLIFCVRGSTTGRRVISDREYCIGRGVCAIRANKGSSVFIYQTINFGLDRLLSKTTGSVFPSLSAPDIKQFQVLNPTEAVIIAYENTTKPILHRIQENHRQAQTLATLRDTLLPRLISGQLRLPDDNTSHE